MDANYLIEQIKVFQYYNNKTPSLIVCDKLFVEYLSRLVSGQQIDTKSPNIEIKFLGIRVVRSEDLKENEILVY